MNDYTAQSELDLKLKLLAGKEFYVDNICIKPKTLRDIVDIGHEKYMAFLGILTTKAENYLDEDAMKEIRLISKDEITMLDVVVFSQDEEMLELFINACGFFLGVDTAHVHYKSELGFVFGDINTVGMEDLIIVGKDNFREISYVIMYQNCVKNPESSDFYRPKNDKAREIIEKLKKNREKVEKAKRAQNNGEVDIDLHSIISSVSAKSPTISKFNIWDLYVYQLYDEYKRLEKISSYETSILAMMNGAKINDLKHWSTIMDS